MIWIWIALGISLLYVLLLLYYYFYWHRNEEQVVPLQFTPQTGVSIIIIARNEGEGIGECIRGILDQNYPSHLFELIIVDDHSSDRTVDEVLKIIDSHVRLLSLKDFPAYIKPPAYKKSGITLAIDQSRFEHIIITDADCQHPPDWLQSVMYSFQYSSPVFQAAPVIFSNSQSLWEKMQEMEQVTLMLITGAGIYTGWHDMANGANMAFTKNSFHSVNGYEGNYHYASGDDMFLVEKMRLTFPEKISFAKSISATVYTTPKKDWSSLLQQRLRWAGKNKGLQNKTIHGTWLFIGAYHICMIILFILAFFPRISWWPFIILITSKWLFDLLIVYTAASFFNRRSLLKYFIPLQLLYSSYILMLGWQMMLGRKGDWDRK